MNLLTIRGLGKSYGAVDALTGLDLDVTAGSRTAVVGPSGSGKTTLLRLIAGFETPDAGEISIDGQRIADAHAGLPAHRRNVGLVMQEGALFPHLSIADNIGFGIRHEPDARDRALKLMDIVELDRSMAGRAPHQLSGGQQQRVALARALARKPRLMLLDEPFSALDAGLREQTRNTTAAILETAGVATILVTHDRDEAMGFADQLVVLRDGRLVQVGAPRHLYLAPRDPNTAAFLGPAIVLDAEVHDGHATCILGTVPLDDPKDTMRRITRILLRPEQLRLTPHAPQEREAMWGVAKLEMTGAVARVTIESTAPAQTLRFDIAASDVPPVGSMVDVSISGTAHAFS